MLPANGVYSEKGCIVHYRFRPLLSCLMLLALHPAAWGQSAPHTVKQLRITILSTMLAQQGIGEWGFSALVEADGRRILFDAGGQEGTVLANSATLKIDLSDVQDLVLSHNHDDHTMGWLTLRRTLMQRNPRALSVTHVGEGIFLPRISGDGQMEKDRQRDSADYTSTGGRVIVYPGFTEIYPGIYLTGPVPRVYPEKNYGMGNQVMKMLDRRANTVDDNVPEDMSMLIRTEKGLVLLSGCGHSGIVNTLHYGSQTVPGPNFYAAIGGFHLLNNTDAQLQWTAGQLKQVGTRYFMGAHCTGLEAVYTLRSLLGLKRGECIVGAVGTVFDIDKGFITGPLNR